MILQRKFTCVAFNQHPVAVLGRGKQRGGTWAGGRERKDAEKEPIQELSEPNERESLLTQSGLGLEWRVLGEQVMLEENEKFRRLRQGWNEGRCVHWWR